MSRRWWIVLAMLALSACARDNQFVLIDEPDGSAGAIVVSNAAGSQRVDRPGQSVRVGGAGAAPQAPAPIAAAQIAQTWGPAMRAAPRAPRSFLLYFVTGTDRLTRASEAELPAVLTAIRDYPAAEVSVIGHTDRVGTPRTNVVLGRLRAVAIRERLVAIGLSPGLIQVDSHGERNPVVPTADEVDEPRNRRVEVMVR